MVQPKPCVALPSLPLVIPERIDALSGIEVADRIGPALFHQCAIGCAGCWLDQRVLRPGLRGIDVDLRGSDIEVASQDDRVCLPQQRCGMCRQTLEPSHLVVEPRTRLRIAVGQVEAADQDSVHRSLDVARLLILRIAGQRMAGQHRLATLPQDRHAVPCPLTHPDGFIACLAQRCPREAAMLRLQLLQAHDIRFRLVQPGDQVVEASIDVVDVECRDLHRGSVGG